MFAHMRLPNPHSGPVSEFSLYPSYSQQAPETIKHLYYGCPLFQPLRQHLRDCLGEADLNGSRPLPHAAYATFERCLVTNSTDISGADILELVENTQTDHL